MTTTISGTNGIDKVAAGAVTRDKLPAGTVLQAVNGTYSTISGTTSTSFSDTGLSATITPISATSKILVIANMSGISKTAVNTSAGFQVTRNGTVVLIFEGLTTFTSSTAVSTGAAHCNYLDSPATTSALTYKVQFKNAGAGTVYINNFDASISTSTITLLEIAA